MQLANYLQAQRYGSRKQCRHLVQDERVAVNGEILSDPAAEIDPAAV